jgi:hypothetical protein
VHAPSGVSGCAVADARQIVRVRHFAGAVCCLCEAAFQPLSDASDGSRVGASPATPGWTWGSSRRAAVASVTWDQLVSVRKSMANRQGPRGSM